MRWNETIREWVRRVRVLGAMWFWIIARVWEAYLGEMMLWEMWLGEWVSGLVAVVLVAALVVGGEGSLGFVWELLVMIFGEG